MSEILTTLKSSLSSLSDRANRLKDQIETEEATKQSLIIPFISALGYDVYDPTEVTPEFTADVGTKKGEKVDYAIQSEGKVTILIECKWIGKKLGTSEISQLYRYFSVSQTRVALLTNGITYMFFTDLERTNVMDDHPFLEFDVHSITDDQIQEVAKLHKSNFNESDIVSSASTLKYKSQIYSVISKEFESLSDDFAKSIISQVYQGRVTASILQKFKSLISCTINDFVTERVNDKLTQLITLNHKQEDAVDEPSVLDISDRMSAKQQEGEKIETTDEEVKGFYIVFELIKDFVVPERIFWRDVSSYFGIILDDNNRKPICRLHFNTSQKYISFFDNENREEEKVAIEIVEDIYNYRTRLVKTILQYLEG